VNPLLARWGGTRPPASPVHTVQRTRAQRAPLLLACAAVWASACGVQGPTRPPRIQQPERVTDLSVAQVGHLLRLSFAVPRLATDGERLTKPLEVQILRAMVPEGRPSPPPTENLDIWRSLDPAEVERRISGERLALTLDLAANELAAPRPLTFRFAVRTLTRGFRRRPTVSDISNVVEIPLLAAPDPVQGLQARATEGAIELTWAAPAQSTSAFRVYRSPTGDAHSFTLIGETAAPRYSDPAFQFGQKYFYKVISTITQGSTVATSEDSQVVEITPRDTFAPAAPRGLTALYTADAVELIWQASSEPDLGGYKVAARKKYLYRVTAQDLSGNESPASEVASAETP
jgi:hypothetical protein